MAVTYQLMKDTTRQLYEWSLKKIPEDSKLALAKARDAETNEMASRALDFMLKSAAKAERDDTFMC
jgi:fumarate hydratase subunit alpha